MAYSDLLKDPRWQKKRLEILQRDNFQCRCCESKTKTLHVHHSYYIKGNDPWEYDNAVLLTLCEDCHAEVNDYNWQKAFADLNLSPKQLIDLASIIQFIMNKYAGKYEDAKYAFNPSWHYFFPFLDEITQEELADYHNNFLPEAQKKYRNG